MIIFEVLVFFIIVLYLWSVQRSIAAIVLHKTMIFQAFFIGTFVSAIMVAVYFTAGFLVLNSSNVYASVIFSPTDPKAGLEGIFYLDYGLYLGF